MSEILSIYSLHDDILRKLPFTISGNASIEKTVFKFLEVVAETPFLVSNRQITFVMGGFAKIDLHNLTDLFEHKWKTRRLRSFFFYDYEDDHVEPILSLYRYCLEELTSFQENGKTRFKNVTNIICDNNYGGVNFRIRVIEDDNSNQIKVTYIRRERVLEARIPQKFYDDKLDRHWLADQLRYVRASVERSELNPYQYFNSVNVSEDYKTIHQSLCSKILSLVSPASFREEFDTFVFSSPEHLRRFSVDVLKNPAAKMNEIYYLFYVGGLLAHLLDCDIEYFTSVSNNLGKDRKYSLGSIAVGYRREAGGRLPRDVRAFFNIVSNHIAQNLAAQILLDSTRMQVYVERRKEQRRFLEDFIDSFFYVKSPHDTKTTSALQKNGPITVNDGNIEFKNEIKEKQSDGTTKTIIVLKKYKFEEIEESFGKGFIPYLNSILSGETIDYGLFRGFHFGECCKASNLFYEKLKLSDGFGLGIKLTESQVDTIGDPGKDLKKPFTNVYLPHALINLISNDDKRPVSKVETWTKDSSALIEVTYKESFSILDFIASLDYETEEGGSFQSFMRNHYDAFRICGDLVIRDGADRFWVSFKEDFRTKIGDDGRVLFTFVGNPNRIVETNKLIFEIQYNLFK